MDLEDRTTAGEPAQEWRRAVAGQMRQAHRRERGTTRGASVDHSELRKGGITTSDATVVSLNSSTVTFPAPSASGKGNVNVSVQPLATGTAHLSLGTLQGGGTPASGGALVINVAQPAISIPSFTIGAGLEAPLEVMLGSNQQAPASNLSVGLQVDSSGGQLGFSSTPTGAPQSGFFNASIPAGQYLSTPFYVQGTTAGTAQIQLNSNYASWTAEVTVSKTALIFKKAAQSSTATVPNGTTANFTVMPGLSPLATPVLMPLAIASNSNPVMVTVTSSNPSVLQVVTPQVEGCIPEIN